MSKATLDRWLEKFGFSDNPFSSQEAGSEDRDRLNEYFVYPPYFDEILGDASSPETTLIFAPRGGGKTAQRVMMDYYCRNNLTRGRILSVLYADFSQVMDHEQVSRDPLRVSSRHHADEVLKQTVLALVRFLAHSPIALKVFHQLPDLDRIYLSWFISTYDDYLTLDQIGTLSRAGEIFPDLEFGNRIGFLRDENGIPARMIQALDARKESPPPQMLDDLSQLLVPLGFEATYILVDRVDEFQETAADSTAAVALIEPLVADLTLMELSRMAFKFFLPLEMEEVIKARPTVRLDRLSSKRIEWADDALLEVLHKRLMAFSNYPSLDAVSVPELRGRVEREMVEMACGSPRNLIRLAGSLLSEHCKSTMPEGESEWLITEEAWQEVVGELHAIREKSSGIVVPKAPESAPESPPEPEPEPAIFPIGALIDNKYQVQEVLPAGRFGQVYRVYDEVLEQVFALKVFSSISLGRDSLRQEARSLLAIQHPNVARIHTWGVLPQTKRLYLVSEFIEGGELTRFITPDQRLLVQEAVNAILDLLSALRAIHPDTDRIKALRNKMSEGEITEDEYEEFGELQSKGWLHRDIKPANLILAQEGLKLVDFNIAVQASEAGKTWIGTPGYMLPDVGIMPWNTDGDLFATGIVLYELVTGHHPYPERQPSISTPPTDPRQYVPELRPEFVAVLLHAVSCDEEKRYHSARRFYRDLQALDDAYLQASETQIPETGIVRS